jgi:hypothetical protein
MEYFIIQSSIKLNRDYVNIKLIKQIKIVTIELLYEKK